MTWRFGHWSIWWNPTLVWDCLTPLHMMEIGICICWSWFYSTMLWWSPRVLYLSLKMSIKVLILLDMKPLDTIFLHVVACVLGPTQFVAWWTLTLIGLLVWLRWWWSPPHSWHVLEMWFLGYDALVYVHGCDILVDTLDLMSIWWSPPPCWYEVYGVKAIESLMLLMMSIESLCLGC